MVVVMAMAIHTDSMVSTIQHYYTGALFLWVSMQDTTLHTIVIMAKMALTTHHLYRHKIQEVRML